jgi:hypothetical protein
MSSGFLGALGMINHFASSHRRLVRAKQHIEKIKSEIASFVNANPYTRVVERNTNGFDEHKVKLTGTIPDEVTDLVYEAIEALRSALDHATHAVAVLCNAKRPDLIHFPVADNASDFENILNGRYVKDLPPDILTFFRNLKSYEAGNKLVWALNRIRRQSTHRLLVPIANASRGILIKHMSAMGFLEVPAPIWNSEKNEIVFAIVIPGSHFDYDVDLQFFVAFGPVEGVAGWPVIGTLEAMAKEVDRILAALEAETWAIRLIK